MADFTVLDRLTRTLSSSEREEMLQRLRGAASIEREPAVQPDFEPLDVEQVLERYGLWRRLMVFLRSLISGRSRLEVVADDLLSELGASIRSANPGIIDLRRNRLLDLFQQQIERLRDSARFFAAPLELGWNRDRAQFLAFLLGLDAPDVQRRLIAETNPVRVAEDEPGLEEYQLKKKLHNNALQILELMPYHERDALYASARFLEALDRMSHFAFDEILKSFDQDDQGAVSAPLHMLAEPLTRLLQAVQALYENPSQKVLQAVALFSRDDDLERGGAAAEAELVALVQKGNHNLRVIWDILDDLPLHDLVRYAHRDINFSVAAASGGEDWFALVKRFWRERVDRLFRHYHFQQQKLRILEQARDYTDGVEPVPIRRYPSPSAGQGKHAASLGVVRAVMLGPFATMMHQPLKTLLIDGEFYKQANRDEYTAAFNGLLEVQQAVVTLESRLSVSGDIGRTRVAIEEEQAPREVRMQNLAELAAQVDQIAERCVSDALDHLRVLAEVIHGILYGEVGGRYDTLSNLGTIGGRSHQTLMQQLDTVMQRATVCREGIGKLYDIENSVARRARNTAS